jgi:hypothetical protein
MLAGNQPQQFFELHGERQGHPACACYLRAETAIRKLEEGLTITAGRELNEVVDRGLRSPLAGPREEKAFIEPDVEAQGVLDDLLNGHGQHADGRHGDEQGQRPVAQGVQPVTDDRGQRRHGSRRRALLG